MLIEIVKLGRPRTWIFVVFAFLIGWFTATQQITLNFFIGLITFILLVWNVNVVNAYTDVIEDTVNLPHRVKYIQEKIGYKRLPYYFATIYVASTILALLISPSFFLVYLLTLFDTLFYSLKPFRFKSIPILDLISFSGAVFLPMLGAWVINNGFNNIPASIFFFGYWFLTYGTVKNIPDYEGDKSVGIRNFATIFNTRDKAILAAIILLLSPFPLLLIFLLLGMMTTNFALLYLTLPIILFISTKLTKVKSFEKLEKFHTYGLIYAVLFLALAFILTYPTLYSAILTIAILVVLFSILKVRFDTR